MLVISSCDDNEVNVLSAFVVSALRTKCLAFPPSLIVAATEVCTAPNFFTMSSRPFLYSSIAAAFSGAVNRLCNF